MKLIVKTDFMLSGEKMSVKLTRIKGENVCKINLEETFDSPSSFPVEKLMKLNNSAETPALKF